MNVDLFENDEMFTLEFDSVKKCQPLVSHQGLAIFDGLVLSLGHGNLNKLDRDDF